MKFTTSQTISFGLGLFLAVVALASAAPVTFQVNMEVQIGLNAFDPATQSMEVHGSFNGWGAGVALTPNAANPNIYETTIAVSGGVGAEVQYKFVMNQSGSLVWENNGVGPGGAQNRAFNLSGTDQVLPVAYFNNQLAPPGVTAVTFQVNMQVQQDTGKFDPTVNTVEVHGSYDNWVGAVTLSPSAADANIYQATIDVTGSAGGAYEHKFVINQAGTLVWEGAVGPGGPNGNRTFTLASGSQQLPVVYFNNLTNNPGAGIPVTFRVNMGVQTAKGLFDPSSGTVDVRGPFNNWGSPSGLVLTNTPDNPTLYLGTLAIATASPGNAVPFKFNMNGTWETGDNRTFILAGGAQTLDIEYFDHADNLGAVAVAATLFDVTVTWTPGPGIRLQTATRLEQAVWEDVPNTQGQSTATLLNDPSLLGPVFFRLAGP